MRRPTEDQDDYLLRVGREAARWLEPRSTYAQIARELGIADRQTADYLAMKALGKFVLRLRKALGIQ